MKDLISVVVPVYNVALYLPECLDSILAQTHHTLQVIVVDDGSTDDSGRICDAYAQKDDRVTVIHKVNGGAASARNVGLDHVLGDYVALVDSDDYLEPDAYEVMLRQLKEHDADIIQCGIRNVFVDHMQDVPVCESPCRMTAAEYLRLFTREWTCSLAVEKLYKRQLLDGVRYEEGHRIDDEFFTYQAVMNAKTVVRSPKIVYNYRQRQSSVMQNKASRARTEMLLDKLDYLNKRRRDIAQRYPELKQAFDHHYLEALFLLARDSASICETVVAIQRLLGAYFKEKDPCSIRIRFRIRLWMLQHMKPSRVLAQKSSAQAVVPEHRYFE